MSRPKVCIVTTSLLVVKFFLLPHIKALSEIYDVTVVANVEDQNFLKEMNLEVPVVHVPIERNVSIIKDLKSLVILQSFLAEEKFSIVHTVAPKAGLIGILAAWLARTPVRLHVFQGEVWATRKGIWRLILKNIDRIIAFLATHLLVVSQSERTFLINEKIISAEKSTTLGAGSISGVDMQRFKPNEVERTKIRNQFNINDDAFVFLYVGRLNKDKGIYELLNSFSELSKKTSQSVHLIIVGPDEEGVIANSSSVLNQFKDSIHIVSYSSSPELYMMAADCLVLPSYREGFGVVIIEAAAVKIPSIGSRIYGISDAIVDKKTGLLFNLAEEQDLTEKMLNMVNNPTMAANLGDEAYRRCFESFTQEKVVSLSLNFYSKILKT